MGNSRITQVLLDQDGVITDWVGGICSLFQVPDPYLDPSNLGSWDIERLIGVSRNTLWRTAQETKGEFWANLDQTKEAQGLITLVTDRFGFDNVGILTAGPLRPDVVQGKMVWIQKHFPQFSMRTLIGPSKEFCAAPWRVLIDDKDSNVDKFREAGGRAILVPRHWNREWKWADVALERVREALEKL